MKFSIPIPWVDAKTIVTVTVATCARARLFLSKSRVRRGGNLPLSYPARHSSEIGAILLSFRVGHWHAARCGGSIILVSQRVSKNHVPLAQKLLTHRLPHSSAPSKEVSLLFKLLI